MVLIFTWYPNMWPIIFRLELSACASCCAPNATDHLKPFGDSFWHCGHLRGPFLKIFFLEVVQNLQFDF